MPRILVSACLLGQPVRYDGRAKPMHDRLLATWQAQGWLVPLCPEVAAGLPTARETGAPVLAFVEELKTAAKEDPALNR